MKVFWKKTSNPKKMISSLIKRLIEAIGFLDKHFLDAEKGINKAKDSLDKFRKLEHLFGRSRELIVQQNLDVEEIKQLQEKGDEDTNHLN